MKALVLGGGGFIGAHLVRRLKSEGVWVRAVDIERPPFQPSPADEFIEGDLREASVCRAALAGGFDEVYQLAADMGGAGYIFTGERDADILCNSALINLNVADALRRECADRVFFSSSACVYPQEIQLDPASVDLAEHTAYPANPDSEYGWEKLFAERLFLALDKAGHVAASIGRFHNIFGPEGTWEGGREKAPAAMCRKIAEANDGGTVEIWGDGEQTRSFLYIGDCLDAVLRLIRSDWAGPANIGSEEMVSIDALATLIADIAGKQVSLRHVTGPLGVRGRTSNNALVRERLDWSPTISLRDGLAETYAWIERQVALRTSNAA